MAKLPSAGPTRPNRAQNPPLPPLPDVGGLDADSASVTYSTHRTKLSTHRTDLSEHRTDLSEFRTDLSTERTEMSMRRTGMSFQRTRMSDDRTLMSVIRTSLSLIGFGFTLAKFFQYLAEQRGGAVIGTFGRTWASDAVGLTMISIGTFSLVVAVIQHRRRVTALRELGLVPQWNLAFWVAGLVSVLGVFAFFSLVMPA